MKLPYGRRDVSVDLTRYLRVKCFTPPKAKLPGDPAAMTRSSLDGPVESPPLAELARRAGRAVIAIPDRTRPAVAIEVLPVVIDELLRAGLDPDRISIFVSTGTHAEHSRQELENLAGDSASGLAVYQNCAGRTEDYEDLGTTERGTPILVSRKILEADLKVVIGTVAYHYFAGWGGGRKMLIPGAAHIETARANHRLTIDDKGELHPGCRNGALEGNPVHEDMMEAAGKVPGVFAVNVLLDGWSRIAGVVSGDLVESHLTSIKTARPLLEVPTGGKCDLAIASAGGHPFDLNFIQAHKSIDHAAGCVRDGGVIIAVAECTDGIGSDNLLSWFELSDAESVSKRLLWQYQIHGHTALALMKKLERVNIILVSSLGEGAVENLGMMAARDMNSAMMMAGCCLGGKGLTYVFPCAWGILPVA